MTNSTIKATTVKTAPVKTAPVKETNTQKPVSQETNKAFIKFAQDSAKDGLTFSQEMFSKRKESDTDLNETDSRRKRLGEAGMRAETHSLMNSYISGLQANELRVLKMLSEKSTASNIIEKSSREHKKYIIGLCAIVANESSNPSLDKMNKAAQSISATFKSITKVHKTVYAMIEAICDNDNTFSDTYIKELMNHEGLTQANYVCSFFNNTDLGSVSKDGSRRVVKINNENPLIIKIRELVTAKKISTGY